MRSVSIIACICSISFLMNCQTNADNNDNSIKSFPVILDTLDEYYIKRYFIPGDPSWLSDAEYQILYIGPELDSIYLDPFIDFSGWPKIDSLAENDFKMRPGLKIKYEHYKKHFIAWPKESNHKYSKDANVEIRMDTTQKLFGFFPVLITNHEFDTIDICHGNFLPMILEAKDSSGKWQAIQEQYSYFCGVGVGIVTLPPNECVLTYAPIYSGDYQTQLRFTIGNNHSAAFTGKIKYRQFRSRWENGDYCDEYKKEMNQDE